MRLFRIYSILFISIIFSLPSALAMHKKLIKVRTFPPAQQSILQKVGSTVKTNVTPLPSKLDAQKSYRATFGHNYARELSATTNASVQRAKTVVNKAKLNAEITARGNSQPLLGMRGQASQTYQMSTMGRTVRKWKPVTSTREHGVPTRVTQNPGKLPKVSKKVDPPGPHATEYITSGQGVYTPSKKMANPGKKKAKLKKQVSAERAQPGDLAFTEFATSRARKSQNAGKAAEQAKEAKGMGFQEWRRTKLAE